MWLEALGILTASSIGAVAVGAGVRRLKVGTAGDVAPFAALLPYEGWAEDTAILRTQRGGLVAVISVEGTAFTSMKEEEQIRLSRSVMAGLCSVMESGAMVRIMAVRDPVKVQPATENDGEVLRRIAEAEGEAFSGAYLTRRYIIASWPAGKAVSTVTEAVRALCDSCRRVGAEMLTRPETAAFWGNRLDPVGGGVQNADRLREVLGGSVFQPDADTGLIVCRTGATEVTSAVVSVVGWGEDDGSTIIDGLLSLPHRLEVVLQMEGSSPAIAVEKLDRAKRVALNQRQNDIVEKEFKGAQELLQSRRDYLVTAQMWIVVTADTPSQVEEAARDVSAHLTDRQVKARIETRGAAPLWLGRMAGDAYDYIMRPRRLLASNVSSLFRMDREPEGDRSCSFGPGPLRMYRTAHGAPYSMQLHTSPRPREQGHFLVVAPTTSGKTVWAQHMLGGALRHRNVMVLAFDRFAGMRVWCEAVQGRYIDPLGAQVGFNPLQLKGTAEDIAFLQGWLCQAARVTDEVGEAAIASALESIFRIGNPRERRLERVLTSFPEGNPIRRRLERLASGPYANVLSAEIDSFALGPGLTVLDMTVILADPEAAGLLASYAAYRIRQAAKGGVPHIILADEVLPMLENPVFARVFAKEGPREHRKLDGCVGFVIQDFQGLLNVAGLSQIILESCKTRVIFPNPDLTQEHAEMLGLSQEEREFVAGDHYGTRHMKRPFLYIRGKDRVFLEGDLSWMRGLLKLYEGSPATARRMVELQEKWGADWWRVETEGVAKYVQQTT